MLHRRHSRGFTLFELVVTILVIGITAAFALDRLWKFQEDAERVTVEYNVAALRSALRIRAAELIAANRWKELADLPTRNPFELLDELPATYGGALGAESKPGTWYYDPESGSAIYLLRHRATFSSGDGQARMLFQLVAFDAAGMKVANGGAAYVKLLPVGEYQWGGRPVR